MEHTPGPWKAAIYRDSADTPPTRQQMKDFSCQMVDRTIDNGDSVADFFLVMKSFDPVDPISICVVGNGPHSEANAYFISQACNCYDELLAACKRALSFLHIDVPLGTGNDHELMQCQIALQSAIAKAEGKT